MISTCSIEFLVILNYPATTNISVVDRIRGLRYNEDPGITNIFFGTVTLRYSGVSLYIDFCLRTTTKRRLKQNRGIPFFSPNGHVYTKGRKRNKQKTTATKKRTK